MKKPIGLVGALFLFCALLAPACKPAAKHAEPVGAPATMTTQIEPPVQVAAPETTKAEPVPAPDTTALEAYLLEAMTKWAPPSSMPNRDVAHYPAIARDVATVVLDPKEKPLWASDANKGRTAVLVAAVAFWESHLWSFVDQGLCNDREWRKTKVGRQTMAVTGDCDGGIAASLWQMHIHEVVLTEDVWYYSFDARVAGQKGLAPADIIADRRLAARAALHMIRKSVQMGGGLAGYTGESGPAPKAAVRLGFAQSWWNKHPLK